MSDDDIDLDRVINDPRYRRQVLDYLNAKEEAAAPDNVVRLHAGPGGVPSAGGRDNAAKKDTDPSQD